MSVLFQSNLQYFLILFLCLIGESFSFQNDQAQYTGHHYSDFKRFESLISNNFNRKLPEDSIFERNPSSRLKLGKKVNLLQKLDISSSSKRVLESSSVTGVDPRGFLRGKLVFIEDMMVSLY